MSTQLRVGRPAPQFTATDVFGNNVSLANNANKYTLLVFLRYAGCPWCNLAIHRLAMEQSLLAESRCRIIAFVQSSRENIIDNIYERHKKRPEFPIIADPDQKLYKEYHVKSSLKAIPKMMYEIPQWIHSVKNKGFAQGKVDGSLLMVPAMFLISEGSQILLDVNYDTDFSDAETFAKLHQKLIFGNSTTG